MLNFSTIAGPVDFFSLYLSKIHSNLTTHSNEKVMEEKYDRDRQCKESIPAFSENGEYLPERKYMFPLNEFAKQYVGSIRAKSDHEDVIDQSKNNGDSFHFSPYTIFIYSSVGVMAFPSRSS